MTGDVPGKFKIPDPSLGGSPHSGGTATHHHGVARPADRVTCEAIEPARIPGNGRTLQMTWRRSRGGYEHPPGFRAPPTSSRGCTRSRGVRVHRGEPLLLGVDEEYQISYRLFGVLA
jgi:hypothetical protein